MDGARMSASKRASRGHASYEFMYCRSDSGVTLSSEMLRAASFVLSLSEFQINLITEAATAHWIWRSWPRCSAAAAQPNMRAAKSS